MKQREFFQSFHDMMSLPESLIVTSTWIAYGAGAYIVSIFYPKAGVIYITGKFLITGHLHPDPLLLKKLIYIRDELLPRHGL